MDPVIEYRQPLPLRAHGTFAQTASYLQSLALLLARLGFGYLLFLTGRGHLSNVPTMIERFNSWGVPLPKLSVYVSGYTEMICGLLLMVGLAVRLISVPLIFNFVVAYLTASIKTVKDVIHQPFVSDNWDTFLNDAAFSFLIISIIFLAFGPGKVSLDYLIYRLSHRRVPTEVRVEKTVVREATIP